MADEITNYDDTIKDLGTISDKLGKVVQHKKKEIADIQSVQKNVNILSDYYKSHPVPYSVSANASLTSASAFVHDFRDYVEGLRPEEFNGPILGSVVASGDTMGSVGLTLFYVVPPPEPVRQELEVKFVEVGAAPKRIARREEIKENLKIISLHLADTYSAIWENLETNFNDPARGAAFLMREVVSQVLDFLAPKELIKVPGFVPDPTAKDGVTRRHKLEYIAVNKAKDNFNKTLIESSIKAFLDSYEAMNDAHKRESLNKEEVESFLFQADDLLNLILGAVKLR